MVYPNSQKALAPPTICPEQTSQCGYARCDRQATFGVLGGIAEYFPSHYPADKNMVDVTIGGRRNRKPSSKAAESTAEDDYEEAASCKCSPVENKNASTAKREKKATKTIPGSTPSSGTGKVGNMHLWRLISIP